MTLSINNISVLLILFFSMLGCKTPEEKIASNIERLLIDYQFENEELIMIDFNESQYYKNQFLSLIEYPRIASKHDDKVFILFGTNDMALDSSFINIKYILADENINLTPVSATIELYNSKIKNFKYLDINEIDQKLVSLTRVNEKGKVTYFKVHQYLGVPIPGDENFMLINNQGKSYDEVSLY